MAMPLNPYRSVSTDAPRAPARDPLREGLRRALAFVLLVAAAKLLSGVFRGFDGDTWVAALVVWGAAVALAPRRDRS
jgi:hypothetical protein